ncbi:class I SAM-dependent methyltransferase [Taibaiella koreensis]|uniref:class I SAM-dependent methyltransferase n=1 Tax=Taibaiella koreensis TaxID=1268548 RepID=UPI000E59C22F|nr:class I SAM-dependent methyltransferase [Taibaiella koreensis]
MDILGQAISDYYYKGKAATLWVHDDHGPRVEMPVSTYFRDESEMPELEQRALTLCEGSVLDIGAGAGSHALALQSRGINVTALDISPLAGEVMRQRGLQQVQTGDIFQYQGETFDTLLLMMNGIGLCGNTAGLRQFLQLARHWLKPGGQLLFDSSDVAYLYEEEGLPVLDHYYGEIHCRYEYRRQKTDWFSWLYIDPATLQLLATDEGWHCTVLFEDGNDQYLARLQPVTHQEHP